MKNFLKFIGGSLFSNYGVLDGKNRKFYQSLIVVVLSLIFALIPIFSMQMGVKGSDVLTSQTNASLDVSLNLFSKYLKDDANASFVTTTDGKFEVKGFKEKELTDWQGNHLLTVYAFESSENVEELMNKFTNGYIDEAHPTSVNPKSFMLIGEDVMYIYTFNGTAKNTLYENGDVKESAKPTETFVGYARTYKGVDFASFYNEAEGYDYCYNKWVSALNNLYKPYKTSTTLYSLSIYTLLNIVIVVTMSLIVMILTRIRSGQCEKLTFVQSLNCVNYASLCPSLISILLGFLITALAPVAFILCLGIRCVFLGFKASQPMAKVR